MQQEQVNKLIKIPIYRYINHSLYFFDLTLANIFLLSQN